MADDERTHTVTGSHQRTIVVADDEPLYADAHSRMLADRYDVKTVYSGAAALEAVDDSVDVLLVDRRMPASRATNCSRPSQSVARRVERSWFPPSTRPRMPSR
ncbi:response regulator [Natrialba swarupiae]|nr:response regulator [Natrialba swarupiae]